MDGLKLELEFGERSLKVLQGLTDKLDKIQSGLERQTVSDNGEEFLTAAEFCSKYRIGRSTLSRRVQEQQVIKNNFGGRTPRYRWADGYGDIES